MIIDFLEQFSQANRGDTEGTIWASKNIDPKINQGKVNISRAMLYKTSSSEQSNLGLPTAFTFFSTKYYCIAGDRIFVSGTSPNSAWTELGGSGTTTLDASDDIITFNKKIYWTDVDAAVLRSYDGSTFNASVDSLGSAFGSASMCVYANRLYIANAEEKIVSMNTSETIATSSSNTLDLNATIGENQVITKIAAASNGIWIGTILATNSQGDITSVNGGEVIFWDGVTENVVSARYKLPEGVMSLIVKDDRPYIIDSLGRLKVFDGTTFTELGRLPIADEVLEDYNEFANTRFIHPNGMIEVDDEIYILVANNPDDTSLDPIERMPSGVWAWNKDYGLYHKYSLSDLAVGGTIADYGGGEVSKTGALFRGDTFGTSPTTRSNESEILAGFTFYSDATTTKSAVGITDVDNDIQKGGYLVTAQLPPELFEESWKEIIALHDKLKNSTDRIHIKFRTSEDAPTYGTGTWAEDTRFTTTTDLSDYDEGDEIEVLRGNGAGACFTINYISGTQVRLTENPLSSMSGTLRFRAQKWQNLGTQKNTDEYYKRLALEAKQGAWVQYKICMVGTGKSPQLIKLISNSVNKTQLK